MVNVVVPDIIARAKAALNPRRVRSFIHVVVGTILLVGLFLVTVFAYQSTKITSNIHVLCVVTFGLLFILGSCRHSYPTYRFTNWFFTRPSVIVIKLTAKLVMHIMPTVACGSLLNRTRLFIDKYVSRPLFPSLVLVGNIVFNLSNLVRTIVDREYISAAVLPWFNEVLYILVSSVLIWIALVIMSTILCSMLMVLRGKRKIVITYKMLLLSAGVFAYHVNMLYHAYCKWANNFPIFSLIPLVIVYTVHAAVQMEAIFANLKCLRGEDIKLSPKSVSHLSILFNITMLGHFFCIFSSWAHDKNWPYMIILLGFELVHRVLALKTFCCIFWSHQPQERINDNELTREIEETAVNARNQDLVTMNEIHQVSENKLKGKENAHERYGLPPIRDDPGSMTTGILSYLLMKRSYQDFSNQVSEDKCYTATELDDLEPLRAEPVPLRDGFCTFDAMFGVDMPTPEDFWHGICCS